MIKQHHTDKTHQHQIIYDRYSSKCPICVKSHGRSKRFNSLYQILYHINVHSSADEIATGITKDDVREMIKHLRCALEWGMFL